MNKSNKITISLIKQVFIVLLSFSISLATKCLSMVRPTLIDLNLVEHKNYLFMSNLDKFNGSCNVLSPKVCIPRKTKHRNTA